MGKGGKKLSIVRNGFLAQLFIDWSEFEMKWHMMRQKVAFSHCALLTTRRCLLTAGFKRVLLIKPSCFLPGVSIFWWKPTQSLDWHHDAAYDVITNVVHVIRTWCTCTLGHLFCHPASSQMSDIFNVSSVVRHSASGPLQEQFIEINVPPLEETVSPLLMTMLTSSRGQMILLPQRPKMSLKATAASSIYYYNLFGMNIRDLTLKESHHYARVLEWPLASLMHLSIVLFFS